MGRSGARCASPASDYKMFKVERRRAAFIATALTVPLVIIAGLVFGALFQGSNQRTTGPTGLAEPLTVSAPRFGNKHATACNAVLVELPIDLRKNLRARVVKSSPSSPYVVAWGSPAVVLKCGVAKPKQLFIGSGEQLFNAGDIRGPFFLVEKGDSGNVYTIIDRDPFISIEIPARYSAGPLLADLVGAIGKALPRAVCSTESTVPDPATLCTRRSSS